MKPIAYIAISLLAFFTISCESGIDPITPVDPGADETAPVIQVKYPLEGTLIRVREEVTTLTIQADIRDDIELESVTLNLNGTNIATYNEFKDYRRAVITHAYTDLSSGEHTLTVTAKDLSGKSSTESVNFKKVAPYVPQYNGEIFYLPFNGDYMELISLTEATKVGNPSFTDGKLQQAYLGATDAYLTFPTKDENSGIDLLGPEFSAAFWYKLNTTPNRAGILVIGPEDTANPSSMNNRNHGFRFFREGSASSQTFKLNTGTGSSDVWFDGGAASSLPNDGEWVHIAFTISNSKGAIYFNGEVVKEGNTNGISWSGCNILSIGSGAPRFTGWNHFSDHSLIDELRLFNKALTQQEVQIIMQNE